MSSSAPSPPSTTNNNNNHHYNHNHHQNKNEAVDKQRLIIALGVGLSIVALITMCLLYVFFLFFLLYCEVLWFGVYLLNYYANRKLLWSASFSIFLNNRNQRRRSDRKPKKSPSERRLRKLDAESPTCTLEEWWSKSKVPPVPSEPEGDGQFIW